MFPDGFFAADFYAYGFFPEPDTYVITQPAGGGGRSSDWPTLKHARQAPTRRADAVIVARPDGTAVARDEADVLDLLLILTVSEVLP